jgi:deazaflavin-dependent oxidoreductase (nitroreductase family)
MVLAYDPASRRAVICSGWGPDADWVRNLRAGPAARVDIGRETFTPSHRFLTDDEAVAVVQEFRRRHPSRVRLITRILAWDLGSDEAVRAFVAARPFVELTPSTGSNAPAR